MAANLLHPPGGPPRPKALPLELVELSEPGSWLEIEDQHLDRVHAFLLAQASIAHHVALLFAKTRRPLPDESIGAAWVYFDTMFQFHCLPQLIGTADDPKPERSYAEIATIVGRFVEKYCQSLPLNRGRPAKLPPDPDCFIGIEELIQRFRNAREWSNESPKVDLPTPSDPDCKSFLDDLQRDEPTEAALLVAWLVAKNERGYDGNLRAFSDAWRDWRSQS